MMLPSSSRTGQQDHRRGSAAVPYAAVRGQSVQPASVPNNGASPLKQNDIVLLEESDLYRFEDSGHLLQEPEHAPGMYQLKSSFSAAVPPPVEPIKYVHSVHSYRSQRSTGDRGGGAGGGQGNYAMHTTPYGVSTKRTASVDTIPAHYGAMRPGGPVNLFTRDYIGLLLNWTIVGFYNGSLTGLTIPLFGAYLNYSPSQMSAATTLISFGWYFKFILGFISDNYAINRQRRKPYIFIGWGVFLCFMLAMTFMNKVAWYGPSKTDVRNADAPDEGVRYLVPLIVASFAHLLATVACEGMMVEFAHREGEYDRGRTQLWCLIFRFIGETSGGVYTALGLNSERYGGTFAKSIPLSWFFASLGMLAFLGIVVTHFFVKEEQIPGTSQSFASNIRRVWRFLEQRVTTQIMVALFFLSIAINATVVEYSLIYKYWFHTNSLTRSLVGIFQAAAYIFAAGMLYFWFLNTNWRVMIMAGFSIAFVLQFPIEMVAVWDIVRSSTLFLAKDWVAGIFEAIAWIVRIMIIVEAAEPGLESTTYGFLSTVCNLANVMLSSSYNIISTTWSAASTDMQSDTDQVRWHITYEFIAKYGMRLVLGLLAVMVLPRQKRHLKEIKIRGAPNLIVPVVLFILVAALFTAGITSAILAMFASTACLPFAGGSGC